MQIRVFLQEQDQDQNFLPQHQDQGFNEWLSNLTFEK